LGSFALLPKDSSHKTPLNGIAGFIALLTRGEAWVTECTLSVTEYIFGTLKGQADCSTLKTPKGEGVVDRLLLCYITSVHTNKEGKMELVTSVQVGQTRINVLRGDITEAETDAIVNAANSFLKHGGGVAAAIVRKGGKVIQEESERIGYVPVGECAITTAGALKAKYVIHAVGPRWGEGDEEAKLRRAVRNTLQMATEKGLASISMPAISAGIFGFPKRSCARIITSEIVAFLKGKSSPLRLINICLMDEEIVGFFKEELERIKD
jgi:O-acetyl-ADP-ribose deacetylase (regulator of RNase III)